LLSCKFTERAGETRVVVKTSFTFAMDIMESSPTSPEMFGVFGASTIGILAGVDALAGTNTDDLVGAGVDNAVFIDVGGSACTGPGSDALAGINTDAGVGNAVLIDVGGLASTGASSGNLTGVLAGTDVFKAKPGTGAFAGNDTGVDVSGVLVFGDTVHGAASFSADTGTSADSLAGTSALATFGDVALSTFGALDEFGVGTGVLVGLAAFFSVCTGTDDLALTGALSDKGVLAGILAGVLRGFDIRAGILPDAFASLLGGGGVGI